MPEPDLSDYSHEELMLELLNRCDHGAIVLMFADAAEGNTVFRQWGGNVYTVAGLAMDTATAALNNGRGNNLKKKRTDDEKDEE
jgi:hypothetical protein